jgi:carnitine 3-dehydrogenase
VQWQCKGEYRCSKVSTIRSHRNLGGGGAGIKYLLEHLGPAMEGRWTDLGRTEHVAPQMAEKAEAGVNEILKVHTSSDIAAARNNVLLQTLKAKVGDKRLPY